jgi:hypothetical protein
VSIIGERAWPYYRAHEPAATIDLGDGDAFDAGKAMEIDSNIGHLQYEGCRQLVTSLGPTVRSYKVNGDVYVGYADASVPVWGATTTQPHQEIFWGDEDSAFFGPFDILADRVGLVSTPLEGRALLRGIQARIDVFITATTAVSTDIYVALVQTVDPERLFQGEYLAFQKSALGAVTGRKIATVSLDCQIPFTPALNDRWTCRATSARGATQAPVVPVYIAYGWRFINSTNLPSSVNCMCAWEKRFTTNQD